MEADFTWVSQGCLWYMVSIQGEGEPLFFCESQSDFAVITFRTLRHEEVKAQSRTTLLHPASLSLTREVAMAK